MFLPVSESFFAQTFQTQVLVCALFFRFLKLCTSNLIKVNHYFSEVLHRVWFLYAKMNIRGLVTPTLD